MSKAPPYLQADAEDADIYALQALEKGTANADQQKRSLDWIINKGCMTYDTTWFPESERASSFASGRRHVGQRIVTLLKLNMKVLAKK